MSGDGVPNGLPARGVPAISGGATVMDDVLGDGEQIIATKKPRTLKLLAWPLKIKQESGKSSGAKGIRTF